MDMWDARWGHGLRAGENHSVTETRQHQFGPTPSVPNPNHLHHRRASGPFLLLSLRVAAQEEQRPPGDTAASHSPGSSPGAGRMGVWLNETLEANEGLERTIAMLRRRAPVQWVYHAGCTAMPGRDSWPS